MADVFLSYANEDRAIAAKVAAALEACGFSVWWDRKIHGGKDFAAEIGRELLGAGAAVVLWSRHSIESEWVRDEAGEAREAGKLVPTCIDDSRPPLGFRQRQAISLARWNGRHDAPAFAELAESLRHVLGRAPDGAAAGGHRPADYAPKRMRTLITGVVAALVAIAIGAASFLAGGRSFSGVTVEEVKAVDPDAGAFAQGFQAALLRELARAGVDATAGKRRSELHVVASAASENGAFVVDLAVEKSAGRTLWSQRLTQGAAETGVFQAHAAQRGAGVLICALTKRDSERLRLTDGQFGALLAVCEGWKSDNLPQRYAAAVQFAALAPGVALSHAELSAAAGPMSLQSRSAEERLRYRAESRREAEKALAIDSDNALANTVLGHALRTEGKLIEAMNHWEKGLMNAYEPGPFMTMEWQLKEFGLIDASLDVIDRAAGRFPDDLYFLRAKADAFAMKGDWTYEREVLLNLRKLDPKSEPFAIGAIIGGDRELAKARFEDAGTSGMFGKQLLDCFNAFIAARERPAPNGAKPVILPQTCPSSFIARMYAALGDKESAFAALNEFYAAPEWRSRLMLFTPEMASLRADPRFWRLAKKLGLIQYWTDKNIWPDFCSARQPKIDCQRLAGEAMASPS